MSINLTPNVGRVIVKLKAINRYINSLGNGPLIEKPPSRIELEEWANNVGIIVACGADRETGEAPTFFKPGDKAIISKTGGAKIVLGDAVFNQEYWILAHEQILAVFDGGSDSGPDEIVEEVEGTGV